MQLVFAQRAALLFVGVALALVARDAGACSCAGPQETLVTPSRVDDAPLNTKVRVEVPTQQGPTPPATRLVLRVHGGKEVDTQARVAKQGDVDLHELTPLGGLAASTQYEVAVIDPNRRPKTIVIGTFKTGTTSDQTAPSLDAITFNPPAPTGAGNGRVMVLSSCSISGPRVHFESVAATDRGRPNAQLLYGVWLGDATGKIDATKPPTRLLQPGQKTLTVGADSGCSVHDFPFPKTGFADLGVAAIDEAGNRSALRTFRIDVKAVTQP
jgi:hypothetical protein